MLGQPQLEWLIAELQSASRTHTSAVWLDPVPWIGGARTGADGWAGHADERSRIADAIAEANIEDLVMVSGDAHMVAIDDGTHISVTMTGKRWDGEALVRYVYEVPH
nr:alkaline phosphatase D family protein [Rhodococcus sp. USK13]